jgi:predicted oxidoreductase
MATTLGLARAASRSGRRRSTAAGSGAGIATDRHARVVDAAGTPIPGLYAAGNDAASIIGGAGITLGPALTFGYVAARHLAGTDR